MDGFLSGVATLMPSYQDGCGYAQVSYFAARSLSLGASVMMGRWTSR